MAQSRLGTLGPAASIVNQVWGASTQRVAHAAHWPCILTDGAAKEIRWRIAWPDAGHSDLLEGVTPCYTCVLGISGFHSSELE